MNKIENIKKFIYISYKLSHYCAFDTKQSHDSNGSKPMEVDNPTITG